MPTGDNERTAAAIAIGLGNPHCAARSMPEDKVAEINLMATSGGVMMIGDGINDTRSCARPAVGEAMGSGTDVALETADAALLRSRSDGCGGADPTGARLAMPQIFSSRHHRFGAKGRLPDYDRSRNYRTLDRHSG